jgi:hypothetical protein
MLIGRQRGKGLIRIPENIFLEGYPVCGKLLQKQAF